VGVNLLHDFNDLLVTLKKAAIEAVAASKPTAVVYGKVISTSPLKINVEQKMTLTKEQLVLTRNVTDYEVAMTVDHATENTSGGSGESAFASHNHAYTGRKTFTVHNGLVVGDKVLMMQMQGGQSYIVIDRVII
jgi:sortase (surface protein transpeptidase)